MTDLTVPYALKRVVWQTTDVDYLFKVCNGKKKYWSEDEKTVVQDKAEKFVRKITSYGVFHDEIV